jgi:hypothetical protein
MFHLLLFTAYGLSIGESPRCVFEQTSPDNYHMNFSQFIMVTRIRLTMCTEDYRQPTFLCPCLQGVGHNGDKVLVLAATDTPLLLDQVENMYQLFTYPTLKPDNAF